MEREPITTGTQAVMIGNALKAAERARAQLNHLMACIDAFVENPADEQAKTSLIAAREVFRPRQSTE